MMNRTVPTSEWLNGMVPILDGRAYVNSKLVDKEPGSIDVGEAGKYVLAPNHWVFRQQHPFFR